MSVIRAIGTAVPANRFNQSAISEFMEQLATTDEQRRKIKTIFRASAIKTRHSVVDDFGKKTDFNFFSNNEALSTFPGTAERMMLYRKHAASLSYNAIQNLNEQQPINFNEISHLINVSCTGMNAPGLDIDLINLLGLSSSINRTSINFMGCFAAINAIKLADAFCKADAQASVLIVCVELCSLHFQKNFTDDNILSNALFADGAAALLIQSSEKTPPHSNTITHQHTNTLTHKHNNTLIIEGFHSDIAHHGANDMAWTIGNLGFEMKLSTYVPEILGRGIQSLVNGLKQKAEFDTINHYVIHPGGKKILDVIGETLNLSHEKLTHCYNTLSNYGNMSSPTVLFALKELLATTSVDKGQSIIAMAFGPGLTMESVMLKNV